MLRRLQKRFELVNTSYIMKAFITILLFLFSALPYSQKVFSVNYANQADVKVFVVDYENEADLKVYKVKYPIEAGKNDGNWFFTEYKNQATKSIYFVDYKNQADLKIFFVTYKNEAGWKNKTKTHFLY